MAPAIIVAGWLCLLLSGAFLATQSGINLTLGQHVGKSLAAVISFATGLLALLVFFTVDTQAAHQQLPSKADVKGVPWWAWIGGPMGAFYVTCSIVFAPHLGAANALSAFTAGQLVTGLFLDTFGLVGYRKRAFHWARALGIALIICGVVLVARFEGHVSSSGSSVPSPPGVPAVPEVGEVKSAQAPAGVDGLQLMTNSVREPRSILDVRTP